MVLGGWLWFEFSEIFEVYAEYVAQRCSIKTGALKHFAELTGKQLWWSPSLVKLQIYSLQVY